MEINCFAHFYIVIEWPSLDSDISSIYFISQGYKWTDGKIKPKSNP